MGTDKHGLRQNEISQQKAGTSDWLVIGFTSLENSPSVFIRGLIALFTNLPPDYSCGL
jgi:hypothetical protein